MLQEEDLVRHFDQTLPNNAIIAEHGYVVWPGGLFSNFGDSHCTEFCGAGRRQKNDLHIYRGALETILTNNVMTLIPIFMMVLFLKSQV